MFVPGQVLLVQRIVSRHFDVSIEDLHSPSRLKTVALARHVAMALARETTTLSLPDIARAFTRLDHTTVLHACRRIRRQREQDREFAQLYARLKAEAKSW